MENRERDVFVCSELSELNEAIRSFGCRTPPYIPIAFVTYASGQLDDGPALRDIDVCCFRRVICISVQMPSAVTFSSNGTCFPGGQVYPIPIRIIGEVSAFVPE